MYILLFLHSFSFSSPSSSFPILPSLAFLLPACLLFFFFLLLEPLPIMHPPCLLPILKPLPPSSISSSSATFLFPLPLQPSFLSPPLLLHPLHSQCLLLPPPLHSPCLLPPLHPP